MYINLPTRALRNLAIILPLFVLFGCVGEGDGQEPILGTPQTPLTGLLVDSGVSGVTWETTGGARGVTGEQGEFQYLPFDDVTFSIGGVVLGTVRGAPYVTVVELTGSNDPTARAATNMLVFLQSIDVDSDPSNGITVSNATRNAAAGLFLDFTAADFSTQVAAIVAAIAPGNAVIGEQDALFNFYQTYAALGGTDTFDFLFPGFPPVGGGVSYELVFADEFNEGTTPNPGNWTIETGYGPGDSGWGNDEWQLYTESPDNVRVEDGNLVLSAQCPVAPCGVRDGSITSGKINSLGKFEFKFGRVEARIKPPVGKAAWPAFWSLGTNFPDIGWPRSGEIDFMEVHNFFSDENTTHFTMHWWDEVAGSWVFDSQFLTTDESLGDDFHIFEAEWDANGIVGKIDGVTYFTKAIDPATMEEFLEEFYLILNVAMGGTLGSDRQPPSGDETFPQTMLVDYVRVYQLVGGGGPTGEVLVDFENAPDSYDFGEIAGFGGGASVVIANPDPSGLNTTAQVARMQKFTDEPFGGSSLQLGSNLNFSQGKAFKMKVWASRFVPVLFKLEDTTTVPPVPENGKERSVDHSGSSMWEELCFDFTSDNLSNFTSGAITFIFDLGVIGDAENNEDFWTFYFDEIEQVASCEGDEPPPPPLISSFSNGSFETGDLSDWASDGNNTVGAPGVGAYAGTLAAQLTTTGGAGVAQVNQTFAANPGDEVNFSAWMLTEAALPAGDTFGLAKIVFKDAAGNDLVPASASIGTLNTDNPGIDSAPLLNADSPVNTWVFSEAQGVAPAGTTQVVVLLLNVDFAGGENPMWFDFVEASLVTGDGGGGDAPTVAAPTPTQDSGDVISLFSDAYTDVTVDTWKADFSQASFADVDIAGNATKEYTNLGFAVVETVASQPDLAGATHFHVDVWTPNGEAVLVKLVDFGPDAVFGFGDDTEGELEFNATSTPALAQGEWISLDIPLADFEAEGLVNRSNFAQLIFSGIPFGDVTLYVDNVYFYNDAGEPPPPPEGLALSNGGFETGDLTDWTGGATVGAPGAGARTGSFAAQLTTSGGAGVGEIRQTFDAAPGDEVNFSAWMLSEAALPTGATFGLAKIVFKDAAGTDLVPASASIGTLNTDNPGIDSVPLLDAGSTPNTWVFTEAQGVAPAGTTQVAFLLLNVDFAGGENPMWFDDAEASLVDGEPPPPPPEGLALSNGGFESGDLTDWTGGGSVGAPGVGARTGSFAAQLTTPGGAGVGEIRQTFDAAPGDEVNFSAWMLSEAALPTGATFGLAKIVFKDAAGTDLVPASASIGTLNTDNPGIDSVPLLDAGSTPNTWVFTEAQGVAPAGTTQVAFLLLNVDFAGGENPMWFDDTEASLVTDGGGGTACAPCTIDFESSGAGGDFGWGVFENGDNPPLEIVSNPDLVGNTSATVAKFTARIDGEFFAGAQSFHPGPGMPGVADIGPFTFDSSNSVVKIWVWKPVVSEVRMQFVNTTDGAQEPLSVSNTKVNEWEQLTFDFTSFIGTTGFVDTDRIVIFPDWNTAGRASENIIYFDEITFSGFEEPPPPPEGIALSNGGFETGDLTDWTGGATVGAPGAGARTGSFAAQLTTSGGAGVGEIRQTFAASPGDEVNFSAWMLSEAALPTGATFGLAKIVFQDAAGTDLVPASASIGVLNTDNPGIDSAPVLDAGSTPNTWVFTEAQGVAPAGTTQVAFLLLNVDFAGGENPMWFDDAEASLVDGEPPPPPPEGLALSNGGFETGDLTDWTGGATVGAPGVGARTGSFAAQLTTPGGAGVGEIRQTFAAAPGDEVNFSAWMLSEAALPTGATFGLAKIVFKDAAGTDLVPASASIGVLNTDNPGIDSAPVLDAGSTPNTWVFTEAQGVAPAGTTQVAFLLLNVDFAGGENPMWFDDAEASLVDGEPPPPPPEGLALSNGGFETGDLTDWTGGATVGAPGVGARTGSFAAQLTTPGGAGVGEIRQTFAAAPGDEVNFSAWMLSEAALPTGATFGLAKIVFKDAAGTDLVPASASIGTLNTDNPGIDSVPLLDAGSTPNTWVFTEAQGVAPAGTTQVAFLLLNVDFAGGENPMWFDDAEASLVDGEPPPPPPEGLALSNGGFETGDLTDWTGGGSVGAPGVGARTGSFAAQLTTSGGAGVGEIRQTFDAAPGDEVNFSAWMLSEAALPTGATFGLAKIVFKDAAGTDLVPASASIGTLNTDNPGIDSVPLLDAGSTPNTWVFTEAQGVAPAGTTQVAFLLLNVDFAGGENPMWFDDAEASLVDGEPPPPPPEGLALSNGGFESGDLTDWTGGGSVGAPGVGARTGSFAAQLTTSGGAGVGEIRQTFDAAPGDEVNFSAWMLSEAALPTGATFGLAKIVFKDAAGTDLVPASASIGTLNTDNPGIDSAPVLDAGSTPNTWVFTEAQGVAPAGTTQVAFLLLNVDFAGGENPMWFDDAEASLVEGEPPPPPPEGIALSNGGFETGDLTDWTGGATVGAPGVGARTGSFAAQLTTAGGAGVGEIRQTFAAIPGDEVNFSAWMLSEAALPTGATFGLAKIVFKDAAGTDLVPASASIGVLNTDNPGIDSAPVLDAGSTPNTWVFTEAQGVAPAGTTQVVFLLLNVDFAGGENPMWFDDAEATLVTAGEPPPPPPPALALSNGGFETGDLTDWTGGATVGAPGVGARTGSFAAQLTTTGGAGVGEIRQTFAAEPGDEINFSVYMLSEAALPTGATFGLAKIVFKDADGNDLVPESASIGTLNTDNPGVDSVPVLDAGSTPNTWVFTEAQGVAPAGTTQVAFLLLNVDFAGGENPMWFDDAQASQFDACGGGEGGELTTNGDFEGSPGTLDCWDIFPGGGTITAESTENNTVGGAWSAHAVAGPGNNPVLKQSFLAAGTVNPGDTILISFDMKGSAVAGGVVFPELIDEKSDMGAVGQLLDTITAPTPGWTTYFYSPMAGPDVAGGITFQIAVVCGGDPACSNNVFIDNVSVMISGGGG